MYRPVLAHFEYCPRCGVAGPERMGINQLQCGACGFNLFISQGVAAAVIIRDVKDNFLLIRRAKEPAKGKLAFCGGFVDMGETGEAAARREVMEELGLPLRTLSYITSCPNDYFYKEVHYRPLDLFFEAVVEHFHTVADKEEVAGEELLPIGQICADELAFPSMKVAWHAYLKWREAGARQQGIG